MVLRYGIQILIAVVVIAVLMLALQWALRKVEAFAAAKLEQKAIREQELKRLPPPIDPDELFEEWERRFSDQEERDKVLSNERRTS
jgi:hypothetical protein